MKKMLFAAAFCLNLAASIPPAHALAISLFPRTMLQLTVPEPGTPALPPLGLACAAIIGKRRRAPAGRC